MNPNDYIAINHIFSSNGAILAAPGEPCVHVEPGRLEWLLADGQIRPVELETTSVGDLETSVPTPTVNRAARTRPNRVDRNRTNPNAESDGDL